MHSVIFSPEKNAFFPASMRAAYEASGSWPEDAVEVSQDEFETYGLGQPPEGMQRGCGADGRPEWVPVPLPPLDEAVEAKVSAIKRQARSALSSTDWYVIRLQETGEAIPESVQAFRASVRQATEDAEAAVAAMSEAGEVLAYQVAWPSK